MKKIEKITKYVSGLFKRYHMNTYGFFEDYDDELDKVTEVPLFRFGEIDEGTLQKLSVNFGITKDEILNMDEDAAKRYWNKYPFFRILGNYLAQWEWNERFKNPMPSAEDLLINAIFTENEGYPVQVRYNISSVRERLINQLKEIDEYMPGTYHAGAEITDLKISTQTIFSFPKCGEMIRSFLEMVNRLKELFFKAIEQDLCEDEANELNFLATWLVAKDRVAISTIVTYDNILCFREIYRKENLKNFFDYVVIRAPFFECCPWRCREFFDDISLVQEYVEVYPLAKSKMRKFGMELTNFSCEFQWSDAKPIRFSDEEELELADFEDSCDLKHTPIEERAKERTRIFVKKNRSEIYGWGSYIKTLKKVYGPVSKGGVIVPTYTPFDLHDGDTLARMAARNSAKCRRNTDG